MKNKNWRSVGWCEVHSKHLYPDRGTAKKVSREGPHRGLHKAPYGCDTHRGWFHIGDLHEAVIAGILTREDVHPKTKAA